MTTLLEPPVAHATRREIETRLAALEAEHDVRILLAVESGSRAWGFPSPDSDYDVRFVYARPRDRYLSLRPGRDVIETPIEDEIDLNGWDVRKALALLLRSNAVILEWIASPIRYRPDHPVVAGLAALADDLLDSRALAHHYASLGRNAAERWLDGDGPVPVKKYFYALRPALAMRCLRRDPGARPPMDLPSLVRKAALPAALADLVATLVEMKSRTNERSNGLRAPLLDAMIRSELGRAHETPRGPRPLDGADRADRLFLELMT